jgi:dTDP-glucose 4,6-dehydratase
VYVYGQGENISIKDWYELIIKIGRRQGYWKHRTLSIVEDRIRPGSSEVYELLVGYQKLHNLSGWKPEVSWEEGLRSTIDWYARSVDQWIGRIDWELPIGGLSSKKRGSRTKDRREKKFESGTGRGDR